MKFTKLTKLALCSGCLAVSLLGLPVAAQAQEAPSGTGKTLSAVVLASSVQTTAEVDTQLADEGDTREQTTNSASDPEWKYVPVRRYP